MNVTFLLIFGLLVLLILVALLITKYGNENIAEKLYSGGESFWQMVGQGRLNLRELSRTRRRKDVSEKNLSSYSRIAQGILASKFEKTDDNAKTFITVSGSDINGKITFKNWPNIDSWWFEPTSLGAGIRYCLDFTKEEDESIQQKINNLYLT